MRILFFDDDPKRHTWFRELCTEMGLSEDAFIVRAKTIQEAVVALSGSRFDWAFLDHDLDGMAGVEPGPRTGLAVARYIAQMPRMAAPVRVVLHSCSPVGARAMLRELHLAGFRGAREAYLGGAEFMALLDEMARTQVLEPTST